MNGFSQRTLPRSGLVLAAICVWWATALAQVTPGAPAGAPAKPASLSATQLETLVSRIALYPDDILAILLPAATTPVEVVKAQRFLDKRKTDPNLRPPTLPEPVKNLVNYPEVVKSMSDDLDWTEQLGVAVVNQQRDVIAAIQAFRRKVQAAGNLKTDDKQIVVVEKEVIKIVPADPQVIYVPQYQPTVVVVQQSAPVVAYYPTPYPVYYYPYPPGAAFATGLVVGAATAYAVGWSGGAIYNNYNVEELQQERMDYAQQSREDWQSHANQAREDRQSQQQQNQQQRSDQASQRKTERQESAGQQQAQRQEAAGSAQQQRSQSQAQRQEAAGSAQQQGGQAGAQRQPGGGQTWSPQQQGQGRGGQTQTAAQRPGDAQFSGGAQNAGAFGGSGSAPTASMESERGAQSRSSSGAQSRSSSGAQSRSSSKGGSSGGGGRGGRR